MHKIIRCIGIILVCSSTASTAHDFWMEANPFYTEIGKTVEFSIFVGNEFVGDSLPNIPNWYSEFTRFVDDRRVPIDGELGSDPAGHFKPEQNGTHLIGYQSDWTNVTIDPDTFLKYLKMEGLDHAIKYRETHKLTREPGREDYIRHVKTLMQTGTNFDKDDYAKTLGYELEIIPLSNPYKHKLNDTISFQVVYQGKPAPELLLIAFSKNNPLKTQDIRTSKEGKASIKLDDIGPWLVKAVKIIQVKEDDADWQSHWASITFEIRNQ